MNTPPNAVLVRWNELDAEIAAREILPCCGSLAWAEGLVALRPLASSTLARLRPSRSPGLPKNNAQPCRLTTPRNLPWLRETVSMKRDLDASSSCVLRARVQRKFWLSSTAACGTL